MGSWDPVSCMVWAKKQQEENRGNVFAFGVHGGFLDCDIYKPQAAKDKIVGLHQVLKKVSYVKELCQER